MLERLAVGPKSYGNFDRFHSSKIRSLLSCKHSSLFFPSSRVGYGQCLVKDMGSSGYCTNFAPCCPGPQSPGFFVVLDNFTRFVRAA